MEESAKEFEQMISMDELARLTSISLSWWKKNYKDAPHFKVKRRIIFRMSEISEWLEARRVVAS